MEFCIISPIAGLERYATLSKTHLVLAHIKDEAYVKFYRERRKLGDTLILDNSAYEKGTSVDWRTLEIGIWTYEPQIVVLPDTLNNQTRTLSDSLRFLDKNLDRFPEVEWMYMVQWDGIDYHFVDAATKAISDSRVGHAIKWFGIPRCLTTEHNLNRVEVARSLKLFGRKFHAMGMVRGDVQELRELRDSGLFESVDSSAPVWRGWMGYSLNEPEWPDIPFNHNAPPLAPANAEMILENLALCGINSRKEK